MTLQIIPEAALREAQALALWRNYWSPGGLELTHSTAVAMHLDPGSRVLDAGCGSGESSLYLLDALGWNVLAVDGDDFGLSLARDKAKQTGHKLETLKADLLALPLANESFDGIFSQGTTFMFGDQRPVLFQEFHRLLKQDGRLGIGEPMLIQPGYSGVHKDMVTLEETIVALTTAGFSIEQAALHPDGARMWDEFHKPHFNPDGSIRRKELADLVRDWQGGGHEFLGIGVVIASKR